MTEPTTEPEDDNTPKTVRVPIRFDPCGRPVEFIETDPEAAGQWDDSRWHPFPPR
jgi:hypothetical protein